MFARGDQARDVGHVGHHQRADLVGRVANPREIDLARIGTGAHDDELRLVLARQAGDLVVVDPFVALRARRRGRC